MRVPELEPTDPLETSSPEWDEAPDSEVRPTRPAPIPVEEFAARLMAELESAQGLGEEPSAQQRPSGHPGMVAARAAFREGDWEEALRLGEQVLVEAPNDASARRFVESCRRLVEQSSSVRLPDLTAVPHFRRDRPPPVPVDPLTAFILSLIEGGFRLEEIADACGTSRSAALKVLADWLDQGAIVLR